MDAATRHRGLPRSPNRRHRLLFHGALLLVSIGFTTQLVAVPVDSLDMPLTLALYCFAAGIPYHSMFLYLARDPNLTVDMEQFTRGFAAFLNPFMTIVTLLGLLAIFWHFAWSIALVAVVSTLLALWDWFTRTDPMPRGSPSSGWRELASLLDRTMKAVRLRVGSLLGR